ncbi:GGDEF domain-containing protein [Marinomonas sp. IMCC 4694]|uniref:GGDEF domain-containing protein n=1 Tax=Marinomonas sp. IMCC 4694 TaxID=2605432 RepID=UPI0021CCE901|nr:GGDEF domain-containing protein [Marinomonas sp. IMCC 4694]
MFQHNIKQANRLMRSAIPLMVKLNIPPTPYNYGIWYEYASNRNPTLNQLVDRALRRFGGLPAFVSKEIFNEFFLPEEYQNTQHQGAALKKLTCDLETHTAGTSDELGQFNRTLRKARKAIKKTSDPQQLDKLVLMIDKSAFHASQAVESFCESLNAAHEELAVLRAELSEAKKSTEIDNLTLLANAAGFERSLFSLTPHAEDDLTLLIIDIDNLGEINRLHGVKAGTSLIRYIANLLLESLPENGFIARLKGGQFAMLLSETELSMGSHFAETIRNAVSMQKISNKNSKALLNQVTVSIGVATLYGDESPTELITRTKNYLQHAKRSGKNVIAHHE